MCGSPQTLNLLYANPVFLQVLQQIERTEGSLTSSKKNEVMKMNVMEKKASVLIALLLALMGFSAGVSAEGSDPLDGSDGGADWDGDGLTNAEEQEAGTNMDNADSDGDGLPDGWESSNGLDPLQGGDGGNDDDGDGLTNAQEYAKGTLPQEGDTDGDGQSDGQDPFPTDPANGEFTDSDGDGIPDVYDPDFRQNGDGSGNGQTSGGGQSEEGGEGEGQGQGQGQGQG